MSFIASFIVQTVHRLEASLEDRRHHALSKYTIEDINNDPSVLGMIESHNEVIDQHKTDLHVAGNQMLRLASLLRPQLPRA